ncbi:MAG: hypothetical protein IKP88_00405 [Lachnospiraceae bacterium]|nr:hypothetical protein [Lachnospiraceae bacterium]
MRKYIFSAIGLCLIISLASGTFAYAAGSKDVLKTIYGENAPEVPSVPGKNADGSFSKADIDKWDAYLNFIKENDPEYDDIGKFVDTSKGDYEFLLAGWESLESLSYSGVNKRSDKLIDLFDRAAQKYVEEYNKRVKEGTTYVTEDMKTVSLGFFTPFNSITKAYVSSFDTNQDQATMSSTLQTMVGMFSEGKNAKVEIIEAGHFRASFDGSYLDDDWNSHPGSYVIDCYYYPDSNGVAMYSETFDESTGNRVNYEIFEHLQIDENTFIFQNNTERLIYVGSEEEMKYFYYSRLKDGEKAYTEEDSIFKNKGVFDMSWVNDRDISAYSLVLTREELDYMKASNGGKFYTIFIER